MRQQPVKRKKKVFQQQETLALGKNHQLKNQEMTKQKCNTGEAEKSQHEETNSQLRFQICRELLRTHQEIISKEITTISVKISKS